MSDYTTVFSLIQTPGFYFFNYPGKGATIGNWGTKGDRVFIISITELQESISITVVSQGDCSSDKKQQHCYIAVTASQTYCSHCTQLVFILIVVRVADIGNR